MTTAADYSYKGYHIHIEKYAFHEEIPDGASARLKKLLGQTWLCGYVEIPESHNLFGVDYDNRNFPNFRVHGGITFAGNFGSKVNMSREPERTKIMNENTWWIGFDTNHFDDQESGKAYDLDYLKKECESLVEQLKSTKS